MKKFKLRLLNILLFPFNIIIFISLIYFRKKGILKFDIQNSIDKFLEDLKKL